MAARERVFYGWWIVLSSVAILMGYAFATFSLPVLYPELIRHFHWTRAAVATGGSIKLLLVGLMAPINGALIDRYGAKIVLTSGVLTVGLSLVLLSRMGSIWQYYLFSFLLGLGLSWIHHLPNHLLVANWFTEKRGLPIGIVTAAVGLGGALTPLVASYLVEKVGWRGTFLSLSFFLALPLLMIIFVIRGGPLEVKGVRAEARVANAADSAPAIRVAEILRNPAFWFLALGLLLMAAAMFGVRDHLIVYLRGRGLSPAAAAAPLSLILGSSIVGRILSGTLSDRFSARIVLLLSFLLGGLSLSALPVATGFWLFYAFPVLFGFAYGAVINLKPLVVFEYFGAKRVGKIYGMVMAFYVLGSSLGPVLTGHIFDRVQNYELAFFVNLLVAGLAILAIVVFAYRIRPLAGARVVQEAAP